SCIASDAENLDAGQTSQKILSLGPDIVGLSVGTVAVNNSIRIAKRLKSSNPDVVTVAGGPHPTVLPDEFFEGGFDFVVRGEGERTIVDLISCVQGKKRIEDIPGLSYRSQNSIIHNKPRQMLKDLNTLPVPAWHLFPIERFRSDFKKTDRSLPILTSRGCPSRCTFCYKELFGNRFRVRSPRHVIQEIIQLKHQFDINEFSIMDDSFTSIPKRAIEICNLLVEENVNLPWSLPSGIRVDSVSEELIDALKRSGCYRVGFGVETGDPYIMQSIKKDVTIDQVRRAVEMAKTAGLITMCYFMIGNLQETEKQVDKSIAFAIELDPDFVQFGIATPYPGTQMYKTLEKEGRITSYNWDDYDSFNPNKMVFRHENLTPELISIKLRQSYR
ncbi:unnamed protein product, partial [marine sediment metagenome]